MFDSFLDTKILVCNFLGQDPNSDKPKKIQPRRVTKDHKTLCVPDMKINTKQYRNIHVAFGEQDKSYGTDFHHLDFARCKPSG
jgi:hypothetical protein